MNQNIHIRLRYKEALVIRVNRIDPQTLLRLNLARRIQAPGKN